MALRRFSSRTGRLPFPKEEADSDPCRSLRIDLAVQCGLRYGPAPSPPDRSTPGESRLRHNVIADEMNPALSQPSARAWGSGMVASLQIICGSGNAIDRDRQPLYPRRHFNLILAGRRGGAQSRTAGLAQQGEALVWPVLAGSKRILARPRRSQKCALSYFKPSLGLERG